MAVKDNQTEESTVGGQTDRNGVPLEEREVVEQPCMHVHHNGETLVPVEDVEALLRDIAFEIQEGIDDHSDTLVFIRPADEFNPETDNPFDTID